MSLSSFIWDCFFFILDAFGKFAAQSNLWAVHHLNLGRFVLCCNLQRFTTFCILHICINTNSYRIWKKLNMLSVWHLFVMEIITDYSPVPKLTFSDLSCARKLALVYNQLCALSWLSHERHCGENFHPYYFCVGWWYVITALPLYWWGSPFCIHITTTSFDIFLMHHVWKKCLMCRCWHSDVDVGVNFDVDVSFTRFDKLLDVDVVVDVYRDQVWQNCLMLHSLDRITSLFLHALAPLTLHVIRFSSFNCNLVWSLSYFVCIDLTDVTMIGQYYKLVLMLMISCWCRSMT